MKRRCIQHNKRVLDCFLFYQLTKETTWIKHFEQETLYDLVVKFHSDYGLANFTSQTLGLV